MDDVSPAPVGRPSVKLTWAHTVIGNAGPRAGNWRGAEILAVEMQKGSPCVNATRLTRSWGGRYLSSALLPCNSALQLTLLRNLKLAIR
jgi:hypothetical protein